MALIDIHSHRAAQYDDLLIRIQSLSYQDQIPAKGPVSIGIHPWHLQDLEEQVSKLQPLLDNSRVVAIGEAGLDRLSEWQEELQLKALRQQIEWSEAHKLPLILHVVKCWDLIVALMKEYKPSQPWIVHGFRGGLEQANQLMDAGLFLSFGLHYKIDALHAAFDRSMALIESDDESFNLVEHYYTIANELNIGIQDLQRHVTAIAMALFPRLGLNGDNMYLRSQRL